MNIYYYYVSIYGSPSKSLSVHSHYYSFLYKFMYISKAPFMSTIFLAPTDLFVHYLRQLYLLDKHFYH